jgi:hypothetical protein
LTFASASTSPAVMLELSETNFQAAPPISTFTVSVVGNPQLCATATGAFGSSGNYIVTVQPAVPGTCTLLFSSTNGGAGSVTVSVTGT